MMLTKHFVFVHLLKSGGTFVKRSILQHAPASWECKNIDGHPAVKDIPCSHSALPRFGFVRNPWDWYVSVYHYFMHVARDPLFDAISKNRTLNFQETILNGFRSEPFFAMDMSPLKYFFLSVYSPGYSCDLLRFESLCENLELYLAGLEVDLPRELSATIRRGIEVNSSPRKNYRAYYTRELAEEIRCRDYEYIEQFQYEF